MIDLLMLLFFVFLTVFSGVYIAYFVYLRVHVKKPWNIKINKDFQPEISILIPVHNEEKVIESKLQNVKKLSYPKGKIEVIIADDASQDRTLEKVRNFIKKNPELNIKIVEQNPRAGKSATLNKALTVSANEIVIVSDADAFWPSDILQKALPYLSSSEVGAITGWGVNTNAERSWATRSEKTYLGLMYLLRLGESKIHSTIKFEGGFCAYKKSAFRKFDCETGADDCGTALEVVQGGYRTIIVPDAIFYTEFPTHLIHKLIVKARRANQLLGLWAKCFKLLLKGRLLQKRVAVLNTLFFICNPIILLALIITATINILLSPFSLFSLTLLLFIGSMLLLARGVFFEILLDNFVLLYALIALLLGRRYITWEKTG